MSNWVRCLVNFVVLFCLANTGGSSDGSGLAILTTTKPSFMQRARKLVPNPQQAVKAIQTHFVKSTTPMPIHERYIEDKLPYLAVILIQYVNEENEKKEMLECGGTIVDQKTVLTDAGCFQNREKKSKTREGVSDNSDFLKLRRMGVLIKLRHTADFRWHDNYLEVRQVDVYKNRNSQEKNQQINIARVEIHSNDLIAKPLPVCSKNTVDKMLEEEQKNLLIVGWEESRLHRVHSVGIKMKVKEKSKCNREHTKRYGGPDTHCAIPRKKQNYPSKNIGTERGGPVVWDGPDKCLVGVINDGDLLKMGRLNWFMKLFKINNTIIFTSLEEYAELSAKHELITIYPIPKK